MRRLLGAIGLTFVLVVSLAAGAGVASAIQGKTTICHAVGGANGGNTHAGYSIITPADPSKHIDEETGEGLHEHDGRVDFVVDADHPCPPQPEEPNHKYRVVAGMPRYRGEVFTDVDGLTCDVTHGVRTWGAYCGTHWDSGRIGKHSRTYVRLRDLTDGSVLVLLDLR